MPDKNLRAVIWLAKTNKRILTRPAVPSGEERGLLSRTAAGDRAYAENRGPKNKHSNIFSRQMEVVFIILRNMPGFGNWRISFAYSPVLNQSRAKMTADIICSFLGTDNVQGQIWLEFIINWYLGALTEYGLRVQEFVLQSKFDVPGSMCAILKSASHTRTFFGQNISASISSDELSKNRSKITKNYQKSNQAMRIAN